MRYFTFMLLFLLLGCRNQNEINCVYKKALISDTHFYQTVVEPGDPIIPLGYPFAFDTLFHLSQIDTLSQQLCKSKLNDCSGVISLKYVYRQDTIYIPAFSYQCNCHVSFSRRNTFHIYLLNDSCFIRTEILDLERLSFDKLKDSLATIFSNTFSKQFEYWDTRKAFFTTVDSLSEYRRVGFYTPDLIIELNDDSEIQNITKYIDAAFDIYYEQLSESLAKFYHKDLCNLSKQEFKLFAFGLFFRITIFPKHQAPIIIEPEI